MNGKIMKVIIKTDYSRRFPDPLNQPTADPERQYNIEHNILLCKAVEVPSGISKEPNPREQNIDRKVYKDIRDSLEDAGDPTFHLKNKGITILAQKVEYSEDKKIATILMADGDGIVDGGHTYEIIMASKGASQCPENQYVRIEVLTGVPRDMFVDITEGLNTAVQVQEASLANLQGKFDWIMKILASKPYADQIAYRENEDKEFEIRELISLMTAFNVELYPDGSKHPKEAYTAKSKCLSQYIENTASYEKLAGILTEILELRDYVSLKSREIYNTTHGGRAGGMTGVYEKRKRGNYKYLFTGEESEYKMYDAALFPILGALRFLVEEKDGKYVWRLGSFEAVKAFFDKVAAELVSITYETSLKYGRKPNAIGKDENHWNLIYKTVALEFLQKKM